jgi:hypothetical protein
MSLSHKRILIALGGLLAIGASLYFNFILPFGLVGWAFLLVGGLFLFWLGRVDRQ